MRTCQNPNCGKALTRNEGERTADWAKRKVCDRACERARRKADTLELLRTPRKCAGGCGRVLKARLDGRGRVKAPKTCRRRECLAELKRQTWEAKKAAEEPAGRETWTAPDGVTYELPANPLVRAEFKRVMKRRAKEAAHIHDQIAEMLARLDAA